MSKIVDKFKRLVFKYITPQPNKQQKIRLAREKIDIYLLLHGREIRSLKQQNKHKSFKELSTMASDILLNEKKISDYDILDLRNTLHDSLCDDVAGLFEGMGYVDCTLYKSYGNPEEENQERNSNGKSNPYDISSIKSLLLNEYHQLDNTEIEESNVELPFLCRKYGALQTVLSSPILHNKPWLALPTTSSNNTTMNNYYTNYHSKEQEENGTQKIIGLDDFGNAIERMHDSKKKTLYYNYLIQLAKATLLKQQIGYSTLPLRSTIPSTKHGLFLNGKAPIGSIISFFPGKVYTSEHLNSEQILELNPDDDDNYQLSMRYDDILIDSRYSPYSMNENFRNSLAFAHLVNHPPSTNDQIIKPNCTIAMVNYTNKILTPSSETKNYECYVPNEFGIMPDTMTIHTLLDYKKDIYMYGLCLVANRDLYNEEIFFDYRLASDFPDWYVPVRDERYDSIYDVDDYE